MQTNNRLLDDLAKVAGGAASTLVGIKDEAEAILRQRLERLLAGMDLVTREEFDAVKAVATRARTEQERLEKRVAALEAHLGLEPPAKTTRKPRKAAAKPAPEA